MSEEEKGFVIKDRRSFDERGELKEEAKQPKEKAEPPKKPRKTESSPPPPLPEVNFNSLIFSLSSTALFHLGEIPDPQTGEKKKELDLAKHAIDTIAMLKDKTAGNLTEEERKFLDSILADLRWHYVKATQ
jgi:hypothetical protein